MSHRVQLLHPADNVAVATVTLSPGENVTVNDQALPVREKIPCGHKVALCGIRQEESIIKYGHVIGKATQLIDAGRHVSVHNVASLRVQEKMPHREIPRSPSAKSHVCQVHSVPSITEFGGYRRVDGRVGVRNHVLVMAAVGCANVVVDRVTKEVPEVVPITHVYGCPQFGKDLSRTRRVLEGYARHPNVGAVLFVGLGCESMPTQEITCQLQEDGFLAHCLIIQEEGGVSATCEKARALVQEMIETVKHQRREPVCISDLVIGTECGASDAWSGITANPALGGCSDLVVTAGGTVILSEVTEFIGAEQVLVQQAASPRVADAVLEAVRHREEDARRMGADLRGGQPTRGNIAGGISTIEEKSLGAIAKGGTTRIKEVIDYAEAPRDRGLVVMDTPGSDLHSVTAMVAGGAQIVVFTTGRGSPTGNPIAPVVKVATNTATYERIAEDIDLNAGTVLEGEPLEEVGLRIYRKILNVANGEKTASEGWRHHAFAIETFGLRI